MEQQQSRQKSTRGKISWSNLCLQACVGGGASAGLCEAPFASNNNAKRKTRMYQIKLTANKNEFVYTGQHRLAMCIVLMGQT